MAYSNAYGGGGGGYGENLPPVPVRVASVKADKNGAGSSDSKKKWWFKGGGSSNPGEGRGEEERECYKREGRGGEQEMRNSRVFYVHCICPQSHASVWCGLWYVPRAIGHL